MNHHHANHIAVLCASFCLGTAPMLEVDNSRALKALGLPIQSVCACMCLCVCFVCVFVFQFSAPNAKILSLHSSALEMNLLCLQPPSLSSIVNSTL